MMANMQNVSSQLMKSPKELASWNFPLSQILEEYFNLLPEPCKIHYGEAALVIQNSVNAYVRRVEELYDETRCLSQKIVVESNEDDEKHFQKEQKSKRCLIDFSQFELLDFDKEIGKNINLKNNDGKSIKFLHRCFSQLENAHSRLQIEVFDIHGDAIGNKYDFRCNQQMTKNGTLVAEFTPKDFENIIIQKSNKYSSPTISKRNTTKIDETLEYFRNKSRDEYEEKAKECVTASSENNLSSNLNSYNEPKEKFQTSTVQDSTCCSLYQSQSGQTENLTSLSRFEQMTSQFCLNDDNDDEIYGSEDNFLDNRYIKDISIKENQSKEREIKANISNAKFMNQEFEKENTSNENDIEKNKNITKSDYKRKNSENFNNDFVDVQSTSNSNLRRSKRLKQTNDNLNNYIFDNMNLLKPIPFKDGIPEKLVKSRKEFRLPCHINLLKRTPQKRKVLKPKTKLLEQPTKETFKNSEEQNESGVKTMKMSIYSPSRPQFILMKEEDQNEFQKSQDERFNVKHRLAVNYDPVTTLTMDLLGFHINYSKESNSHLGFSRSMITSNSNFSSPQCSPPSSPLPDNLVAQISPSLNLKSLKKNLDKTEKVSTKSVHNFEKLVKHKIKKIYEELDLQTDEDQNVARWHEEIKPRLMEAERKPPFRIHEYESRIIQRLETCDRKLQFDEIVREEPPCEVARYFSATLQLASTNNLNINTNEDLNKSIELVLLD